jgi:hypothetical protein
MRLPAPIAIVEEVADEHGRFGRQAGQALFELFPPQLSTIAICESTSRNEGGHPRVLFPEGCDG